MKTIPIRIAGACLFATILIAGMNAQPRHRGTAGQGPGSGQNQQQDFGQGEEWSGRGQAWRHQRNHRHGQGQGRMARHVHLDLSDEQKAALKQLRMDHYKATRPLKNKLLELKASERTLMSEENVDMKKVSGLIDEQTALVNQLRKLQAQHKVKVKGVFSEEQEMKLEQHRRSRSHQRPGTFRPVSS